MRVGNGQVSGIRRTPWFFSSKGFTLVELIIVILIIGILVGISVPLYLNSQKNSRDKKRIGDMRTIEAALEEYKFDYDCYPESDYEGPYTWDDPSDGDFIHYLTTAGYLDEDMTDDPDTNLRYYRYNGAVPYGGPAEGGQFYVLGVLDMEGSGNPHPNSPGWWPEGSGGGRNWQNEFDWVTGSYTNDFE